MSARKDPNSNSIQMVLVATQVTRAPLEELMALFGGQIYKQKSPARNQRGLWQWRLTGARAADAIGKIMPFMVSKTDQAQTFVELGSLIGSRGGVHNLDPTTISKRIQLVNDLKEAKRRLPAM